MKMTHIVIVSKLNNKIAGVDGRFHIYMHLRSRLSPQKVEKIRNIKCIEVLLSTPHYSVF